VRLDGAAQLCEEIRLLVPSRNAHALEDVAEPDIDVEIACILMEVQDRARTSRKVTTLALPQLWEFAQLLQQLLQAIKVLRGCMPHVLRMAPGALVTQMLAGQVESGRG
jgi:hypothetical protein